MFDACPYCYRSKGIHKNDPILLPEGAIYDWISDTELVYVSDINNRWYKGFQQVLDEDIIELQTELTSLELSNAITPLTTFSLVNINGKFQITGQHIKEMRDSVEKLIVSVGISKIDYFNNDENGTHVIRPSGDQSDWTDPITNANDLDKFQVKFIHIEELRKKIEDIWENFEKGLTDSVSVVGDITTQIADFSLQKNQLWAGHVTAVREYYNSLQYWSSNSSAVSTIMKEGSGSAIANAKAYGGTLGFYPNGVAPAGTEAFANSLSSISALIPVIIPGQGITAYPCYKTIFNTITQLYDTYHLFIKANCSVVVSCNGGYTVDPNITYTPVLYNQGEIDAWNAAPVVPNTYHNGRAEVKLVLTTTRGTGAGGALIELFHGAYHYMSPSGIVYNLTDFDIDIPQTLIDYGIPSIPISEYLSGVVMTALSYGTANSLNIKVGDAVEVNPTFWAGQTGLSGGYTHGSASFTIDNISLYYRKMSSGPYPYD